MKPITKPTEHIETPPRDLTLLICSVQPRCVQIRNAEEALGGSSFPLPAGLGAESQLLTRLTQVRVPARAGEGCRRQSPDQASSCHWECWFRGSWR